MVIVIIFVLLIIFIGVVYNSLVRKKNQTENAFATIDVMLKKRYDLIPNLVATVRQYAKYEEGVFTKLTEMRSKSYVTLSNSEKANLDDIFTHAHTGLLAIAESYPELKASDNFMNYSVLLMKLKSNWLLQGVHIMPVSLIIIMQCRPFHLTYWLASLGLTVKGYGLFRNRNVLLLM